VDAIIFDFDGVVVDSEPIHLKAFQEVLARNGVEMTRADYYETYLGFDDHDCFAAAGQDHGVNFPERQIAEMTARKTRLVQRAFAESLVALPGAVELIAAADAAGVPLAVCSGALRDEIELASKTVGAWEHFKIIVPAEDVQRGKPDPQGYQLALERLADAVGKKLLPGKTIAVEDSPAGIAAAKDAHMIVLAVTNSYPPDQLRQADRIVESLADVTLKDLEELLAR